MIEKGSTEKGSRKGRVGQFAFGVFWTLFSSIFVVIGLWMTWKAIAVSGWDEVPCEMVRFEIVADPAEDPVFRPDLEFQYRIDGRDYTGTRLWPDRKGSDDYEDLAELREGLSSGPEGPLASPAGASAECRVNPADPSESALFGKGKGELVGGIVFTLFGSFFVAIGIGLIAGDVRGVRPVVKSGGEAGEASPVVAAIAFLFFGLAGLGVLGGLVLPKAAEWASMRGWQETPAEIIWSRVARHSDSDGTTYAVDLFYRYTFNGREHRSNRYDLIGGSSSGSSGKQAVVRAHPKGSSLRVWVDPDKPWRAVVKRDPGWWGLFALFPLPFLAIGFGGLWWYFKKRHEGSSVSRPRGGRVAAARARRQPVPAVAGEWIKVGRARWAAFLGLAFFALFWNGIVSFGVRDAWSGVSGSSGIGRIFGGGLGLFMIPFVVIGIGVATYSQGTSTSTAKSVFHERVLFETTVPLAMAQGRVDLTIPADGVPTLHGKHNKILWLLFIRATVPRLPDLNDEREIQVNAPQNEEHR